MLLLVLRLALSVFLFLFSSLFNRSICSPRSIISTSLQTFIPGHAVRYVLQVSCSISAVASFRPCSRSSSSLSSTFFQHPDHHLPVLFAFRQFIWTTVSQGFALPESLDLCFSSVLPSHFPFRSLLFRLARFLSFWPFLSLCLPPPRSLLVTSTVLPSRTLATLQLVTTSFKNSSTRSSRTRPGHFY